MRAGTLGRIGATRLGGLTEAGLVGGLAAGIGYLYEDQYEESLEGSELPIIHYEREMEVESSKRKDREWEPAAAYVGRRNEGYGNKKFKKKIEANPSNTPLGVRLREDERRRQDAEIRRIFMNHRVDRDWET